MLYPPEAGIIYIVTGDYHTRECIESITSIREHSNIPITVFSDRNVFGQGINFVEIKNNISPFKNKVKHLINSPYKRTLFLDSDTLVVKPINELFDMLDDYDLCFPKCPDVDWTKPVSTTNRHTLFLFKGYVSNSFSSGIILYRKSDIFNEIYNGWKDSYFDIDDSLLKAGSGDQIYLNQFISNNPSYLKSIGTIPNKIYHATCCIIPQLRMDKLIPEVKLYHSHNLVRHHGQVYWIGEAYAR